MEKENHVLQLNDGPFASIKAKTKTIEMRLYDEKRQKIKAGDIIKFLKRTSNKDFLYPRVKNIYRFDSFAQLYENFDKVCLGYKENETARPEDMSQFYSEEETQKYGVVGIEIEVI